MTTITITSDNDQPIPTDVLTAVVGSPVLEDPTLEESTPTELVMSFLIKIELLQQLVKEVAYAAELHDTVREELNTIHVEVQYGKLIITAADGYRLAQVTHPIELEAGGTAEVGSVMVDAKDFKQIMANASVWHLDFVRVTVLPGKSIRLDTGDANTPRTDLTLYQPDGIKRSYPKSANVIAPAYNNLSIVILNVDVQSFIQALKRTEAAKREADRNNTYQSSYQDYVVRLEYNPSADVLSVLKNNVHDDIGKWAYTTVQHHTLRNTNKSEIVGIGLRYQYLMKALKRIKDTASFVELRFSNPNSPVGLFLHRYMTATERMIRAAHVIMPVSL